MENPESLEEQAAMEEITHDVWRSEAGKRADSLNAHAIAQLGTELMNAFNHGKTDPSDMAVLGHDMATGFEFCIERNGVTYVVSVARDWAT